MSTLVLGSSGLVGRELITKLAGAGHQVVACDVAKPVGSPSPEGITYVSADMSRLDQMVALLHEHEVSRIACFSYVMGPLMSPGFADFLGAQQVNIMGVTNVLEAARLTGVRRVLLASTVGTYGDQSLYGDREVNEDDVLAPRSMYGRMKALNEAVADRYRQVHGLDVVKVRPSSILGSGSTIWPSRLIERLAVGETGYAPYGPQARDNIVAVDDLTTLLSGLLNKTDLGHDTYLACGHNVSMAELVTLLGELLPESTIEYPADRNRAPTYAQVFDNSRAVKEIGWELKSVRESVCLHINGVRRDAGLAPLTW
ncbi:NAD-dependent epimerase/dehydratase family protein [Streptomyces sulphureus]|uniref:NAD-dependent epimerase/dehydratase family protein n=1 Tax=Streptomyces sulphureus TaxID=47758 RepID=UPI00036C608E|nr:NAD(P)-dependent oxidoreductase [Streptomyces sulphureus]